MEPCDNRSNEFISYTQHDITQLIDNYNKMKTDANNVYDGHAQQKLVTPHIRDRYLLFKIILSRTF